MLIKGVTKKGNPVPFTARESLLPAVTRAVKNLPDADNVWWVEAGSLLMSDENFNVIVKDGEGNWGATCQGTIRLGRTEIKTDRFFVPVKKEFEIEYQNSKDNYGLPDIEITKFSLRSPESAIHNPPMPEDDESLVEVKLS